MSDDFVGSKVTEWIVTGRPGCYLLRSRKDDWVHQTGPRPIAVANIGWGSAERRPPCRETAGQRGFGFYRAKRLCDEVRRVLHVPAAGEQSWDGIRVLSSLALGEPSVVEFRDGDGLMRAAMRFAVVLAD